MRARCRACARPAADRRATPRSSPARSASPPCAAWTARRSGCRTALRWSSTERRASCCAIRTLDVGGDKRLPYLPLPPEENPFLGVRGIRTSLERPDLLRSQLRAILEAAPLGDVHVMFPMIASLDELRAARRILDEEQRGAGVSVRVGVMIEVPSAA